ncbi:uncharacterized protein LY79DRAFT_582815 [Colletotrichum navitas]|uniref:Uncharacterized protein n=1 Tax=Colletotrichum navitas TaxID=681940 RepID=A0AAD8PQW7_9PEZI|nr:uncharacterized protein LY79DRAFT_582815 [Colletotrichum navitas]KAK1574687.1 hypothetical protein LY79DRAFT_582815 [Colletotrichum navitas]
MEKHNHTFWKRSNFRSGMFPPYCMPQSTDEANDWCHYGTWFDVRDHPLQTLSQAMHGSLAIDYLRSQPVATSRLAPNRELNGEPFPAPLKPSASPWNPHRSSPNVRLSHHPKPLQLEATSRGLILDLGPGQQAVGCAGRRSYCGRIFSLPCWASYCVHGRAAEMFGWALPPPAAVPKQVTLALFRAQLVRDGMK